MDSIVYNTIGDGYNTTRRADPSIVERLYRMLQPQPGQRILDIGCGTGNYTLALANKGLSLYGVDPSEKMLAIARARDQRVTWATGSAEGIPAEDDQFDGAYGTLTLHHWTDLRAAFAELRRVLKPGSRLVFFTATPAQMEGYWLNHYFPVMLEQSIGQMPTAEAVGAAVLAAGFKQIAAEPFFIPADLQDHFLYTGKHRPGLYFDADIRNGISSFSALANREEVETGLARLSADLASGHFTAIKNRYCNDRGDYLFLAFEKERPADDGRRRQ